MKIQFANTVLTVLFSVWWLVKHILPLFRGWQFGNVANFLHDFHGNSLLH